MVSSVFPTPVGPENKNDPIGLSLFLNPTFDNFIDEETIFMALSCPNIKVLRSRSKFLSFTFSSDLILFSGILAIFETVFCISSLLIFFDCLLSFIFTAAAVSSRTSRALSGNLRFIKYFFDRLTASLGHSSSNVTL